MNATSHRTPAPLSSRVPRRDSLLPRPRVSASARAEHRRSVDFTDGTSPSQRLGRAALQAQLRSRDVACQQNHFSMLLAILPQTAARSALPPNSSITRLWPSASAMYYHAHPAEPISRSEAFGRALAESHLSGHLRRYVGGLQVPLSAFTHTSPLRPRGSNHQSQFRRDLRSTSLPGCVSERGRIAR